ncbi:hypothetical protein HZH68_012920 [Vespula germanica]|uniref:Uncharacterized protein n=1 Tax=Vespula germanica TaxID=30212 RepID=A0A834MY21_VESGE|nr:hypothetical protein HZH68_012920 [Vespula germanica]
MSSLSLSKETSRCYDTNVFHSDMSVVVKLLIGDSDVVAVVVVVVEMFPREKDKGGESRTEQRECLSSKPHQSVRKNVNSLRENRHDVVENAQRISMGRRRRRGRRIKDEKVQEQLKNRRHRHLIINLPRLSSKEGFVLVMSISRARSWPLLDAEEKRNCRDDDENHKSKKQNEGKEEKEEKKEEEKNRKKISDKNNERPTNAGSPQVQARRLMCRHYYPEGGWGWIVTVVGTLVHLLGPGLQLSVPATLAIPATVKFYHHPLHTAGISYLDLFNLL